MKKKSTLLSGEALASFCGQMAMVLRAGYSLEEGLVLLSEDDPGLEQLLQDVRRTGDLAAALEKAGSFPAYFLRMVHLGQETGRLEDTMEALSRHYRRELELRRSLRDAVGYPLVMLAIVLVILSLLLSQVMPLFQQAFAQLGAEMAGLPLVLLELGAMLRQSGWVLLLVFILSASALVILQKKTGIVLNVWGELPFFRSIMEQIALSRLTGALALALSSGLSTHYALELATEINDHEAMAEKLKAAKDLLNQGEDLAEVLRTTGILRGAEGRLALMGRRTGSLDTALSQISQDCREAADRAIDRTIAAIEPVMVAVLSILVGIMLLSVLVPMLGLLTAM